MKRFALSVLLVVVLLVTGISLVGCSESTIPPASSAPATTGAQSDSAPAPAAQSPDPSGAAAQEQAPPVQTAAPAEEAAPVEQAPAPAPAPKKKAAPAKKSASVTVYTTDTGSKYHVGSCRYLSRSKIAISLDDAKAQGLEPCKVCRPPQ